MNPYRTPANPAEDSEQEAQPQIENIPGRRLPFDLVVSYDVNDLDDHGIKRRRHSQVPRLPGLPIEIKLP